MDEKFNQNRVTQQDPRFVYDKRVDFKSMPKEDNSWDENDDEYFDDDFA